MNTMIILSAALLPAILLWLYIWKKDTQKEPTPWLIKAVLWGVVIIIPVAILESGIEAMLFGEGGKPTSLLCGGCAARRGVQIVRIVDGFTEESIL